MKTKIINGVTYVIAENYDAWILNSKLISQNLQKGKVFGINAQTGVFCQIPEENKYTFAIITDEGFGHKFDNSKDCIDMIYTMFYDGRLKFGRIVINRTSDNAFSNVPAFGQRDLLLQTFRAVLEELKKENNSVPFTRVR